ncbi:type II toxin-antitoxin system RelE/ParE family toxin [Caballeronia sp. Lep1P3]|uniref:type II toxin-antitoxin system RelE/ParE family toxin n=1 Tax=Caballeronia sp. Lep1P3 TaxID=2878150 RepID=UPI001FD33D89|nr:type II toxin-antitoxin system RelE/ParE family toxin [Caballeronia sp. Lep1P3]
MLTSDTGPWTIAYYSARVKDEVWQLPPGILASYFRLTRPLREHGPGLPLPHARPMGDKLFELRPAGHDGIGRVFYCTLEGRRIVILHSFAKKTQRTPLKELHLARKRLKEVRRNG